MTPNEIYAIPATRTETWRQLDSYTINDIFKVPGFDDNGRSPADDGRLLVEDKLFFYQDSERGTSVQSLVFDGNPIALLLKAGEDGDAGEDCIVTDEPGFTRARAYVVEQLVAGIMAKKPDHNLRDPAVFDLPGYHNAFIVTVGEEVRLVDAGQCGSTGKLVYDEVAVSRKYSELFGTSGSGLVDDVQRKKAIEVLAAGVVSDRDVLIVDRMLPSGDWLALGYSDGLETYFLVCDNASQRSRRWADVNPTSIGPASMLDAVAELVRGGKIRMDSRAVCDVVEAFGCTPLEALQGLETWSMDEGFTEHMLDAVGYKGPECIVGNYGSSYRVYSFIEERPKAVQYCKDQMPTIKMAAEMMDNLRKRYEANNAANARISV